MNEATQVVQVVSGIIALLLAAAIVRALTDWLKLPFTVVLVLAGIGLSLLAAAHPNVLPAWHDLELSPALVLYVFLPSLVFESAFNLDNRQLRENIAPVLTLAVPGLLLSTLAIALIVRLTTAIPFPAALLLGAILSATDPVAVIAVFKKLGAPIRLRTLVEGESLFNDATSLVLARLVLAVVVGGAFSGRVLAEGVLSFVFVFAGGLLTGWILGRLAGTLIGPVQDNFIEITLTTVLAYVSFIVAEQILDVSGIMATIAAGVSMGGWGRIKVSAAVRSYLEHFWEYMAAVANALIFLMVGLRVDLRALWLNAGLLIWVVVAMLVSRAIVVYGLIPLVERLPKSRPISRSYQTVIYWGGLRGAIALAIVLSLPKFDQRESFIAVVMGAVLFTLLVNGLTIEPLLRLLGLNRPPLADRLAKLEGEFTANQRALRQLPELLAGGLFHGGVALRLQRQIEEKLSEVKGEIEKLHAEELNDDQRQRALLYLRGLAEERYLYVKLFDTGQMGERAFRRLIFVLESQINMLRDAAEYAQVEPNSRRHRLEEIAIPWLKRFSATASLGDRFERRHIATGYEIGTAQCVSSQRVLSILDELARVESTPWYIVDKMRRQYNEKYETAKREVTRITERYPEFINDLQERFAQRLLLLARAESYGRQAEHGTLSPEVAESLRDEIRRELRTLNACRVAPLKLELIDLLRRWTPLQNLSRDDLAYVAIRMRMRFVPEGEVVVKQDEPGSSMSFVVHGVLGLSQEDDGTSKDVATLMAGDFFGESAVLRGEAYPTTVTAVTPCSLYEVERTDLRVAMEHNPRIRAAIEEYERAAEESILESNLADANQP